MQRHEHPIGIKVPGTFLTPLYSTSTPRWGYQCRCDCGVVTYAKANDLTHKRKRSCGCGLAIRDALCYTDDEIRELLKERSKKAPSGCIEWQGAIQKGGYGSMRMRNKPCLAHRASWVVNKGEIPDGLCVLHKCDNRKCINPDHLFIGTQADNNADCISKGRARRSDRKGEKHPMATLKASDVFEIRRLCEYGMMQKKVAKMFGVSKMTISDIHLRKKWKHI